MLAAEAGIARTAPRQPHVGIAVGVEPHRAGVGPLGEALHAADVAAPYAGSEAVRRTIGDPQRIRLVAKLDDAYHRPEDFLLRDPHLVLDIGEDSGTEEIAAVADTLAAGHQ